LLLTLSSCDHPPEKKPPIAEYIFRLDGESYYNIEAQNKNTPPSYPWKKTYLSTHTPITKEHFRCKGSMLNAPQKILETEECMFDCNGINSHSLPLKNEKEFIYPILLTLLNKIQEDLQAQVIITSGHRCPKHNRFCDPSVFNLNSKHQLGAEVSFYVQGYEWSPQKALESIFNYYEEAAPEYKEFQRYTQTNTNVAIEPWHNKEIFIKYFQKDEGRNFDNQHPYPYIAIQVRFDKELNERLVFEEKKAIHNFYRK
jgi:hypothetical protein